LESANSAAGGDFFLTTYRLGGWNRSIKKGGERLLGEDKKAYIPLGGRLRLEMGSYGIVETKQTNEEREYQKGQEKRITLFKSKKFRWISRNDIKKGTNSRKMTKGEKKGRQLTKKNGHRRQERCSNGDLGSKNE